MKTKILMLLMAMILVPVICSAQLCFDTCFNDTPVVPLYEGAADKPAIEEWVEIYPYDQFLTTGNGTQCYDPMGYRWCNTEPNDTVCKALCGVEWSCYRVTCWGSRCFAMWLSEDYYNSYKAEVAYWQWVNSQ